MSEKIILKAKKGEKRRMWVKERQRGRHQYLIMLECICARVCVVPFFIFCVCISAQSSMHGHVHVCYREAHLQPVMERPEGRRWTV